jgi:protease-4
MARNRDKIIVGVIIAVTLVFFVIGMVATFYLLDDSSNLPFDSYSFTGRVAIIEVVGIIESSENVVRQIKKYQEDSSVKALVVRVESPGGGVAASQEIYEELLKFKESGKNLIVSMGAVAASGGYYIACAADTIVANPGTVTGSIGVVYSFPTFTRLMDKVGVELEVFKSGDLKDVGSFGRDVTEKDRRMLQSVIDDTYNQFINVIAETRELDIEEVKKLADGSIFTGLQSKELGMIDEIGTFSDAISIAGEISDLGDDPKTIQERKYHRRSLFEIASNFLGLNKEFFENRILWPVMEYRYTY